jgi:hypothetical protein
MLCKLKVGKVCVDVTLGHLVGILNDRRTVFQSCVTNDQVVLASKREKIYIQPYHMKPITLLNIISKQVAILSRTI